MGTRALIDEFFAGKRFALVGISSDPKNISRYLYDDFLKRGYDVIPVNPAINEINGNKVFASVTQVNPKVENVMIMTQSQVAEKIIEECSQAGISLLWLYRSIGQGAASHRALELCEQKNIRVIPGYCPFMFFPDSGFIHKMHGFFLKLSGKYPQ